MTDQVATQPDPTTQRMMEETGHACVLDSLAVRDLRACAHNLLGAIERGEWDRVPKKAAELRRAHDALEATSEAHFAALKGWMRP